MYKVKINLCHDCYYVCSYTFERFFKVEYYLLKLTFERSFSIAFNIFKLTGSDLFSQLFQYFCFQNWRLETPENGSNHQHLLQQSKRAGKLLKVILNFIFILQSTYVIQIEFSLNNFQLCYKINSQI